MVIAIQGPSDWRVVYFSSPFENLLEWVVIAEGMSYDEASSMAGETRRVLRRNLNFHVSEDET